MTKLDLTPSGVRRQIIAQMLVMLLCHSTSDETKLKAAQVLIDLGAA